MLLPWQMLLPCFVCCFIYWGWCFYLIIECISCINKCKKILSLGWWYCQCFVADVSNHWGRCYYLFLYMLGWCYCLLLFYVAGVIPHDLLQWIELADVSAKWLMELPLHDGTWLMLLPSGWWNCHYRMLAGRCYDQQADVICQVNF